MASGTQSGSFLLLIWITLPSLIVANNIRPVLIELCGRWIPVRRVVVGPRLIVGRVARGEILHREIALRHVSVAVEALREHLRGQLRLEGGAPGELAVEGVGPVARIVDAARGRLAVAALEVVAYRSTVS